MQRMNLFSDNGNTNDTQQDLKQSLATVFEFLKKCEDNTADYPDTAIESLNNTIANCNDERIKSNLVRVKSTIANRLATELILIDLNISELTTIENFMKELEQ